MYFWFSSLISHVCCIYEWCPRSRHSTHHEMLGWSLVPLAPVQLIQGWFKFWAKLARELTWSSRLLWETACWHVKSDHCYPCCMRAKLLLMLLVGDIAGCRRTIATSCFQFVGMHGTHCIHQGRIWLTLCGGMFDQVNCLKFSIAHGWTSNIADVSLTNAIHCSWQG